MPGASEVILDDPMTDVALWKNWGGKTNQGRISDSAASDGVTIGTTTGDCRITRSDLAIPYDGVSLYRFTLTLRTAEVPSGGAAMTYAGFSGLAEDGVTYINTDGDDTAGAQHFCALVKHTVAPLDTYTEYTGYLRGWGTTGTYAETPDPDAPGVAHEGVAFLRPNILLAWNASNGSQLVDRVLVERITQETRDVSVTVTGDQSGRRATASASITGFFPNTEA